MVYIYPYRPIRVIIDAILRHKIAGLLRQRGNVFQPWGRLVKKSPEMPFQSRVLFLIPVEAAVDRLISARIKPRMKADMLIFHMEKFRRPGRIPFPVKVYHLFFVDRMDISL